MNKYLLMLSIALVIILIIIAISFLPREQYGESIGTSTTPYYTSPVTEHATIPTFTSTTPTYTTTSQPAFTTTVETTTTETPQYPWSPITVSGELRPIGPDGGDMHFVYVTRNHILFASHGFGGVLMVGNGGI